MSIHFGMPKTAIKLETIEISDQTNQHTTQQADKRDDDICELEHLRKLFIGGLAPYTTEEGLKQFYGQWGNVVDVVVMRDPATKRSRGFGFITYTKSSMVDAAQANRPHVIDGKNVEAKRALPRPERESRETNISVKKLFVGGLKDNHDEECLKDYFSQFGQVVSIKILTDRTTGKRRGFAFIEFDDYDAVDKAILQKSHQIKYVIVDVKKSIYSQEQQQRLGNASSSNTNSHYNANNNYQAKQANNAAAIRPPNVAYHPPPAAQGMPMPAYQQPPPMHAGPPPTHYNYWGPPPPHAMPPAYGYQQPPLPQPPHMNGGWNYPPAAANQWNGAQPPPPTAAGPAVNWHANQQWHGPPPVGPPAVAPPGVHAPPVRANWNAPPAQVAAVQGPPVPHNPMPATQPPPVVNYGTGYQQNYAPGAQKQNNLHNQRINPYSNASPAKNFTPNGPPPATAYSGYNGNKPVAPQQIPAAVAPRPPLNAAPPINKFRR